jgi:Putative zinc-finger
VFPDDRFPDADDPSVDWGTLTCGEFIALCTDYLEGALPPGERARFEHHITVCRGCDIWLDQIRTTVATIGRVDEGAVPTDVLDGLLDAFRDWKTASPT